MSASWSMRMPTIARDGSSGLAIVRTFTSTGFFPCRRTPRVSVVARFARADPGAELRGRLHGDAVDRDHDVSGLEHLRGRHIGRDAGHEDAARGRDDVVAERAESDDRRDLLRALHVGGVLPVPLCVGLAGRRENLLGDERRRRRGA